MVMADPPGATATSGGPGKRKISETGTATNGVGAVGDAPAAGAIGMASATGTAAGPIPTLTPPPFDFLERARTLVANLMGVEGYTMEEAHGNECKFLVTIKTYKRILKPSIPNLKAEVRRRYELYKTARLPTSTSKPPIASLSRLYAVRIHLQELSPLPITSKEDLQEMKAQLDAIRRVIANEDAGEETTFEEACVKVWAAMQYPDGRAVLPPPPQSAAVVDLGPRHVALASVVAQQRMQPQTVPQSLPQPEPPLSVQMLIQQEQLRQQELQQQAQSYHQQQRKQKQRSAAKRRKVDFGGSEAKGCTMLSTVAPTKTVTEQQTTSDSVDRNIGSSVAASVQQDLRQRRVHNVIFGNDIPTKAETNGLSTMEMAK